MALCEDGKTVFAHVHGTHQKGSRLLQPWLPPTRGCAGRAAGVGKGSLNLLHVHVLPTSDGREPDGGDMGKAMPMESTRTTVHE